MLKQRIITALALVALLVGAMAIGPRAFGAVLLLGMGIAAFEWLRLAAHTRTVAATLACAMVALLLVVLAGPAPAPGTVATVGAVALGLWLVIVAVVARAARAPVHIGRGASTVACVLLLSAAAYSAIALLRDSFTLLISAMAIVWMADIAAYFSGRRWGRAKLAVQISPGKTWAGAVGALVGVAALATVLYVLAPHWPVFSTVILQRWSFPVGMLLLCGLVVLSIVGDLFESLLKRQAGVKDSGTLLPGHGGVFDRIDALLPVLPVAALIVAKSA